MNILLHPTYFPSIAQFVAIAQADSVTFEMFDNFQKQTYRNRAYIYGANGKLKLSVPVIHTHKERQLYKDVPISDTEKWQLIQWKSLESAYKTSPFFEFYEDELKPLFTIPSASIFEHNIKCFQVILDCLQLDVPIKYTSEYQTAPDGLKDYRTLANARQEQEFSLQSYTQVFSNKHGYIANLSILDLLFNEGTNALSYLEAQQLP